MFKALRDLYLLMDRRNRRRLLALQFLIVAMSLGEVISVLSIGPFMALVGNLQQLHGHGVMADAYRWSGLATESQFVIAAGLASLAALTAATLLSMYTLWRLYMYGVMAGAELGNQLFAYYLTRPWLFHTAINSSDLTNNIAQETQRITFGVITPFMQLNAKVVLAVLMAGAIFAYDPVVASVGVGVFAVAYMGLYRFVRAQLVRNGDKVTTQMAARYKLMNEGFGGIRELLVLGRQSSLQSQFVEASHEFAMANGSNQVVAQIPRYAMELLAFGAIIALVLYLTIAHGHAVDAVLPVISVYALAGMKLLPAFQQVYASLTQIRGNLSAVDSVRDDLQESSNKVLVPERSGADVHRSERLLPASKIELRNVTFAYPNTSPPALAGLSVAIPANKAVGLVGASGSGKSTAIDLLLGLLHPADGQLLVDGRPVEGEDLRAYQNSVGFVPQTIFLADASIRENIAFGIPSSLIEDDRVRKAARLAHLEPFLDLLPEGMHTNVGERGVQLSGGQRQRIGIARALYHDPAVLVLDEATSALDGITEKAVMDAIHDFGGKKTIVMIAHRIATVRECDWIYVLEGGRILDQGTYEALMLRNESFKRMART